MGYAGMVRSNYAAGDYYMTRGGFKRGDPGILGSLFHGITGAVGGLLSGGPLGAITGGVSGLLGGGSKPATPSTAVTRVSNLPVLQTMIPSVPPPTQRTTIGPGGMLYSSTQYAPGGATEAQKRALIASLGGRKRRRMNVANPRALRRALRRVAGFGKLAQRARRDIGRAATAVGAHRTTYRGGSRGVITKAEASRALRR